MEEVDYGCPEIYISYVLILKTPLMTNVKLLKKKLKRNAWPLGKIMFALKSEL